MRKSCLVAALIFSFSFSNRVMAEEVYTMGFSPAENAETVTTNGKVVADLIFKKTGIKIKTYVATDYTALVESMRGGRSDFAWLAAFTFVLAERHAGAKVLLKSVRHGKPVFYSSIVVRSDKPYKTIQDLKGKNIAWVDPASASGYIVPKSSLINDGIDPDKFFGKQIFAGGHDTVDLAVLNGTVDAGATFADDPKGLSGSWTQLTAVKPEYKDRIRSVYVSQPIPNDTVATTEKFYAAHKDIVDKVTDALLHLADSPEGKKALHDLYRIDGMVPAVTTDYEPLRKAAAKLDIDIGKKEKMIQATELSKQYPDGTKGLDNVSLTINQGEFIAVIGRSGSGKSTFLRQVNGTILPTGGNLNVLGCDIRKASSSQLRKLRCHIGFIFQQFNLVKSLTVMENVLTGRLGYHSSFNGVFGLYTEEDKKLAAKYLNEVGLEGRFNSRADQLSGGQQQRVAIARALVQDPKIILADEPMASLDPKLSEVVLQLLKTFNESKKITVIVNIHVLELAKKYAGRIIGLKAGKVVYDGPPGNLTEDVLRKIYD